MTWWLAFLIAITPMGPLLPAPQAKLAAGSEQVTFAQGSYVLHIPPGVAPEGGWDWAVNYHGKAWNGAAHEQQTGMSSTSDARIHKRVIIYPDAQGGTWRAGFCCSSEPHRDDVAWTRLLVADAATRVPLKATGDFIGGSNGGMMAWRMACDAPDLAAHAVVIAGALVTDCRRNAVHVLRLHGLNDNVVPLCKQATVPDVGCQGGNPVASIIFWSTFKTNLMMKRGSDCRVRTDNAGHTWTGDYSDIALDYLDGLPPSAVPCSEI